MQQNYPALYTKLFSVIDTTLPISESNQLTQKRGMLLSRTQSNILDTFNK